MTATANAVSQAIHYKGTALSLGAVSMQEEKAHEAHLKALALAEKANVEKQAQELELTREQELQAY